MTDTTAQKMIVDATSFNSETDYTYTKPKVNPSGGKSIGIINSKSNKGLYLSTPLMLTWGVNEYVDEKSGRRTYDMTLQFPKDEYKTELLEQFLTNMQKFEERLKRDAVKHSKEWMNKTTMSAEVVEALWTPMLKYPKDKESGEFDYDRSPTLRLKIPIWEGEWKVELYDMEQKQLFPNEAGLLPTDLIAKATNVATVMQCGGLWFANGKFGVTWKLVQAVVKPKQTLRGQCFINLSADDKAVLTNDTDVDDETAAVAAAVEVVDSSSDEEEVAVAPTTPVKQEVQEAIDEAPNAPKKKVVRRRKGAE